MASGTDCKLEKIKTVLGNQKELDELTEDQLNFILHPLDTGSFLKACPGSGKTQCVGIKLAYHVSQWNNRNSGIAVLSFTRNAANEIKKRATLFLIRSDVSTPHFVGTIDSWIHSFIFHPFSHAVTGFRGIDGDYTHRLISEDSNAKFLERYSYKPNDKLFDMYINILHYSINYMSKPIWIGKGDISFPDTIHKILFTNKKKFATDGFTTYSDIEYWSFQILKNQRELRKLIAKRFPYILIDECQDLSGMQLAILHMLIRSGVKVHLIGDLDQSIYEFRNVYPELVEKCIDYWRLTSLELIDNFRSTQTICDFASKLKGRKKMKARNKGSENDCLLWEYGKNQLPDLQSSFLKILKENFIKPDNAVIIARGHSTLNEIRGKNLGNPNNIATKLATALFIWTLPNKTGSDIGSAFKLCSEAILDLAYDGKRNIYQTPDNYSSIEWRTLIVKMLDEFKSIAHFQHKGRAATWSEWINIYLKPKLQQFWSNFDSPAFSYEEVRNRIRASRKTARNKVEINPQETNKKLSISLETIHGVKGKTYDAVLLVSSPTARSDGGYFVHWLRDQNHEHNRFAYVACTRPRKLLIVAIPKSKDNDSRKSMINMGLKPMVMP